MIIPFLALQKAVYDRLSELQYPVYDIPPQDQTGEWIQIGRMRAEDWGDKTAIGFTFRLDIHAYSPYKGYKQVKEMLQAIYEKLREPFTIEENDVVVSMVEAIEVAPEAKRQRGTITWKFKIRGA